MLYHFLDLSVINAYIIHKVQKKMPLFEFKLEIAMALMYGESFGDPMAQGEVVLRQAAREFAENGEPIGGVVRDTVRFDGYSHFPEIVSLKGRYCKVRGCEKRSTIWCNKCHVYLCIKKGQNCFLKFHTEN